MDIDLNADLGEGYGPWRMGEDEALLELVSSANVACGFHAGDPVIMERTVRTAKARGIDVGAHVGFPDRQGFGRRPMQMETAELASFVVYQLGALAGRAGHAAQCTELVGDHRRQLAGVDLHHAAAETLAIGEADVRADVDAPRGGGADRALHDHRVAGVEAAGHVGRRHHAEQRLVVAHAPGAVAFAEVRVEVDVHRGVLEVQARGSACNANSGVP